MIGKRLRDARKKAKLTQVELARLAGIDELTVSRLSHYETDKHAPNFQQACRFADVLDIPECYLYCRDDVFAEQLLTIYQRHKRFRLNPSEIVELERALAVLSAVLKDVHSAEDALQTMLQRRMDVLISEELPSSLKP
jgi:transcriptional regulator with XRE-family HTH domain